MYRKRTVNIGEASVIMNKAKYVLLDPTPTSKPLGKFMLYYLKCP